MADHTQRVININEGLLLFSPTTLRGADAIGSGLPGPPEVCSIGCPT
jgi:hypothetical protein